MSQDAYLSFKHMAKVASTVRAGDLYPLHAICIVLMAVNSPWNVIPVRRPPTTRIKLCFRPVSRYEE